MTTDLLVLHGALGCKEEFNNLKHHLSPYFKVHVLNFEGHGHEPSQKDFSIDLFTSNAIDYVKKHELDNIKIFGFSMGGYVALNLALKKPQMVNAIMTLGTKFDWTVESSAEEVKMLNPDVIEIKVPKYAAYLAKLHGKDNWKALMTKTTELMFNLGKGGGFSDDELTSISHNVLLCLGDKDNMVSLKETKEIADRLKNSSLRLIQDFKHPIASIDSAILAEHVTNYFK